MLRVLPLVTAPDQRLAVSRCPIKPQLLSTWLITAPASCSQPEQSTVASSQFRDITFQTVSSVSSSYLLHPCRPPCPHPPLGPLFIFIPPCSPQQCTTAPLVLTTTLRCSTWTFEYLDIQTAGVCTDSASNIFRYLLFFVSSLSHVCMMQQQYEDIIKCILSGYESKQMQTQHHHHRCRCPVSTMRNTNEPTAPS